MQNSNALASCPCRQRTPEIDFYALGYLIEPPYQGVDNAALEASTSLCLNVDRDKTMILIRTEDESVDPNTHFSWDAVLSPAVVNS